MHDGGEAKALSGTTPPGKVRCRSSPGAQSSAVTGKPSQYLAGRPRSVKLHCYTAPQKARTMVE